MQLTKKEKKLITECLLFATGSDLCAVWPEKRTNEMIDLAKRMNDPKVKLDEIYLLQGDECLYDDVKLVKKIVKNFPNLPRKLFTV